MIFFLLAFLFILVMAIAVFLGSRKEAMPELRTGARYVAVLTPVLGIGLTVYASTATVPVGNVGLVYTFGSITGQRPEGLQWVLPWQAVTNAVVQIQGHKFEKMASFSSETQAIQVTATINVRVTPDRIQSLYRDVGSNYFDVLVRPRVLQAFKDETVKYPSVDIAPKREEIRAAVRLKLVSELEGYSILVEDLLIDDITFGADFEKAIEEKQKQSQLALAEREKVSSEKAKADQALEAARGEAGAILIKAEKQAEANRKLSESISPELIQYQYVTKLASNMSVMMVPQGQNFILPDPLKK